MINASRPDRRHAGGACRRHRMPTAAGASLMHRAPRRSCTAGTSAGGSIATPRRQGGSRCRKVSLPTTHRAVGLDPPPHCAATALATGPRRVLRAKSGRRRPRSGEPTVNLDRRHHRRVLRLRFRHRRDPRGTAPRGPHPGRHEGRRRPRPHRANAAADPGAWPGDPVWGPVWGPGLGTGLGRCPAECRMPNAGRWVQSVMTASRWIQVGSWAALCRKSATSARLIVGLPFIGRRSSAR